MGKHLNSAQVLGGKQCWPGVLSSCCLHWLISISWRHLQNVGNPEIRPYLAQKGSYSYCALQRSTNHRAAAKARLGHVVFLCWSSAAWARCLFLVAGKPPWIPHLRVSEFPEAPWNFHWNQAEHEQVLISVVSVVQATARWDPLPFCLLLGERIRIHLKSTDAFLLTLFYFTLHDYTYKMVCLLWIVSLKDSQSGHILQKT